MAIHRQRPMMKREIVAVTPLTKDDLARLREPRRATTIKRLKESHHFLARLFASGMDCADVAKRTGFTYARVKRHYDSPAFKELIAQYRTMYNEAWLETVDDYQDLVYGNMIKAELQIADKLAEAEEQDEILPVRELIAISRDAADRMGYGKKSTNVNVNVDFASRLENAVRRSAAARIIDGRVAGTDMPRGVITEVPALPASGVAHAGRLAPESPVSHNAVETPAPVPFRRRA